MDEDDLPAEGSYEELPEEPLSLIDTDDGGAIIVLDEGEDALETEFYANLAEGFLPDSDLKKLSQIVEDFVRADSKAREARDEQYQEGIRRTGLGDEAPGGAKFEGASKVVHPMLTEACIDFSSRVMKEIFPVDGPAKAHIIDPKAQTRETLDKADRKTRLLNYQLTTQVPEFRSEIEQLMTQVPLGGVQYLKLGWDFGNNRPRPLFVAVDDMFLPYAATNFASSPRKTHRMYLTQMEHEDRVLSGEYRDVDLSPLGSEVELSLSGESSDKIEGREQDCYNDDGLREVWECHARVDIDGDTLSEGAAPYIITVDKATGGVLAVYRNWDEEDARQSEFEWFVEWPFVPWRGAYPIGLPHMIGGLSGAATGALRALLDSAHMQNQASLVRMKGKVGGQDIHIDPNKVTEVEGNINVDDIRKLVQQVNYNPPSPVLFQLLGFLIDAGKGVVRTTLDDVGDMHPNAPVGTTLARLGEGMVVFSEVHTRLHGAMGRMLRILHRMNAMYLDDEQLMEEVGSQLASREDFQGPMDIAPVSDPNIFSEAQRFAQIQAVEQRAQINPTLYNLRKLEERILEMLKLPNWEELLAPEQQPKEQNAVNENVAASLGRPITAFPEQDHLAHITAHVAFLLSPNFGLNPLIAPAFIPVMLSHMKEHIVLWYASRVFDLSSEVLGTDVGEEMKELGKDSASRKELDNTLAEASLVVLQEGEQAFQQLPPIISKAQEILQALTPQPPADPKVQIEQAKLQQKTQSEQMRLQLEQQDRQADNQLNAQELAQEGQQFREKLAHEREKMLRDEKQKLADIQARMQMNREDNAVAAAIASAEIETGEKVAVENGRGVDPDPGS